jgi:predicted metal-dependent phosphoesterase TrpH
MIKVDLHVHTCYSVDGTLSPEATVEACLRSGVGALAITDHNTIDGALAVRQIAPFPVIIGQEISTAHGEMMGLFTEEQVARDLSALETMKLIKEQGGLVGVPHPFDRFRPERLEKEVLEEIGGELDFVEGFNGRVTLAEDNRRAQEFAGRHGLACTAGSDAHIGSELGRAYLEMDRCDGSKQQFLSELPRARIGGRSSPFWVHFFSLYAKARNRLAGE